MKDKLRELAARWKIYGSHMTGHECADELLAILDAEGDGGAAPDDDLPGMWSNADFTGGDPDERCHAARVSEDEQFNAFRLAYYGANKSLAPELESFRRAYQTITHPARSGVVSDEDVRDAERWRYLVRENNKGGRGAFRIVWFDEPGDGFITTDGVSVDGKDEQAIVRIVDAAIQGECHER